VLGDVDVHAVDDRHDHDQCCGGDDHAEQRQEGTQLWLRSASIATQNASRTVTQAPMLGAL